MSSEIISLKLDTHQLFEQIDYLQQRVQKQEQLSSKFKKVRRDTSKLSNTARGMRNQLDELQAQGYLRGLDPELENDTSELRQKLGGQALPSGTRETLFHRCLPDAALILLGPTLTRPALTVQNSDAHAMWFCTIILIQLMLMKRIGIIDACCKLYLFLCSAQKVTQPYIWIEPLLVEK